MLCSSCFSLASSSCKYAICPRHSINAASNLERQTASSPETPHCKASLAALEVIQPSESERGSPGINGIPGPNTKHTLDVGLRSHTRTRWARLDATGSVTGLISAEDLAISVRRTSRNMKKNYPGSRQPRSILQTPPFRPTPCFVFKFARCPYST